MGKHSKKNKKEKVNISMTDEQDKKSAAIEEEEPEKMVELGKDFYKIPLIIAAVTTVIFYVLVFIFVK